jgi:biopolymer transport protein ExbB/TolQ
MQTTSSNLWYYRWVSPLCGLVGTSFGMITTSRLLVDHSPQVAAWYGIGTSFALTGAGLALSGIALFAYSRMRRS